MPDFPDNGFRKGSRSGKDSSSGKNGSSVKGSSSGKDNSSEKASSSAKDSGIRKIAPVEVPLSHPVADSGEQQSSGHNRFMLIGLVVSVLLALMVIFVLPELVKNPESPAVAVETIQPTPAKPLESPWQEAQLAKARRESQDILNQILEKQQFLEQKKVQLWAKDRFTQAMDTAAQGDIQYRQREFAESLATYGAALGSLTALENEIPQVIEDALTKGSMFLESGDAAAAAEQFERVLAIEPDHQQAGEGLQRSGNLDQVLQWVAQGRDLLEEQQLDEARKVFARAVELDPESKVAREGKSRVDQLILERDYNRAMSEGYRALEAGRLAEAEQAFSRAAKLRPEDRAAASALTQARNSSTQRRLNRLLASGAEAEGAEQWQQAVSIYQKILSSDASVIDARVGQLRAQARADLDSAIQKLLDNPLRLATPAVFSHGQQVLSDAKGVSNPGPRLQRQIRELQTTLKQAAEPVAVKLVSDNQTQVNLFKVGDLGNFNNKQLMLKPGNYVAMGVRPGYRDVRVEFQVTGENAIGPITIICNEPV